MKYRRTNITKHASTCRNLSLCRRQKENINISQRDFSFSLLWLKSKKWLLAINFIERSFQQINLYCFVSAKPISARQLVMRAAAALNQRLIWTNRASGANRILHRCFVSCRINVIHAALLGLVTRHPSNFFASFLIPLPFFAHFPWHTPFQGFCTLFE
jgi:hypothetical protein